MFVVCLSIDVCACGLLVGRFRFFFGAERGLGFCFVFVAVSVELSGGLSFYISLLFSCVCLWSVGSRLAV